MNRKRAIDLLNQMIDMHKRINNSYRNIAPEKVTNKNEEYEQLREYIRTNLK